MTHIQNWLTFCENNNNSRLLNFLSIHIATGQVMSMYLSIHKLQFK